MNVFRALQNSPRRYVASVVEEDETREESDALPVHDESKGRGLRLVFYVSLLVTIVGSFVVVIGLFVATRPNDEPSLSKEDLQQVAWLRSTDAFPLIPDRIEADLKDADYRYEVSGLGACRGVSRYDDPEPGRWNGNVECKEKCTFERCRHICSQLKSCKAFEIRPGYTEHCEIWVAAPQATVGVADGYECWMKKDQSQAPKREKDRRGSFLVLGDWGFDHNLHGDVPNRNCQKIVAEKMDELFEELGDVRFVVNLGDSFYPGGVPDKNDWQWQTKWRDVYSPRLRSVPWYSVYGNHDYVFDKCACSEDIRDCALVNDNIKDLSQFYMPNLTWSKFHPELDLEVVAMDLNLFVEEWEETTLMPKEKYPAQLCGTPGYECHYHCWGSFKKRADASVAHFFERHRTTTARNMVVFSHYPTDYLAEGMPDFMSALRDDSRHHIEYFGGHRHSVDQTSTASTHPNNNWVNGGGGGWACDGDSMGFVMGHIDVNYTLITYPVIVPASVCCR
eukprot:TRINITY_DN13073_c0_g1_i3.p1 TRINITY_DN13073_c0_g1~~TRINITY_DN13073_c0_g1_i3.p1  ORF type:complete len:506 (+),score=111.22 TRINITY_DN13073_c0_g1_i3:236-1753(+)